MCIKIAFSLVDGKSKGSRVKPVRDRSEQRELGENQEQQQQALIAQAMLESGYGMTGGRESKRGSVLSQIIGKVRVSFVLYKKINPLQLEHTTIFLNCNCVGMWPMSWLMNFNHKIGYIGTDKGGKKEVSRGTFSS